MGHRCAGLLGRTLEGDARKLWWRTAAQRASRHRAWLYGAHATADLYTGPAAWIVHAKGKAESRSIQDEELTTGHRTTRRIAHAVSPQIVQLEPNFACRKRWIAGGVSPSASVQLHGMNAGTQRGRDASNGGPRGSSNLTWGDANPGAKSLCIGIELGALERKCSEFARARSTDGWRQSWCAFARIGEAESITHVQKSGRAAFIRNHAYRR